jgi:hypothetical protein
MIEVLSGVLMTAVGVILGCSVLELAMRALSRSFELKSVERRAAGAPNQDLLGKISAVAE